MNSKKLAKYGLAISVIFGSVGAISACNKNIGVIEKTEEEKTYNLYVEYMNSKGDKPLPYEQWLESIKGEKGEDGISPQVRINQLTNYWEISTDNGTTWTSTGVKATGEEGKKGDAGNPAIAPLIRINKSTNYWEISIDNGKTWDSTGVKASIEDYYDKNEVYKDVSNNFSQVYNEAVKSVVKITATYGSGSSISSGVVYKEDGNKAYILTNAHVLNYAVTNPNYSINVLFSNYVQMTAEFVYLDKNEDVAVICVEKNDNYQIATIIENDSDVKIGDSVFAIGNPQGNYFSVTTGVINANRIETSTEYISGTYTTKTYVYNSSATVNSGNSGGPLFNSDGKVISINTMFPNDPNYRNYNYSIPINHFINVANYIVSNKTKFIRGSLSIDVNGICDYSVEQLAALQISVQKGAYIMYSNETLLPEGNIITHVNGVEVITAYDYEFELLKYQKNSVIQITTVDKSGNNKKNVEVILK